MESRRIRSRIAWIPFQIAVIAVCVLLFLALAPIYASEPSKILFDAFQSLQPQDGLAYGYVLDIAQDEQGFLWFGTQKGLSRFDGYSFINFFHQPEHPESLPSNLINALLFDSQNRFWIGTYGNGLVRFDREQQIFISLQPSKPDGLSPLIQALFEDHQGRLWIGHALGLHTYHPATEHWTKVASSSNDPPVVRHLLEYPKGILWVGTDRGLGKLDLESEEWLISPEHSDLGPDLVEERQILGLHRTADQLFVLTQRHIARVDLETGRLNREPSAPTVSDPTAWRWDRQGQVWIGSAGQALTRWLRNDNQGLRNDNQGLRDDSLQALDSLQKFERDPADPNSLVDNWINKIFEDRDGNLWFATQRGVSQLAPNRAHFQRYFHHPNHSDGIPPGNARALSEDSERRLWVGTQGGGVAIISADRRSVVEHYRHSAEEANSLSNDRVLCLLSDHQGRMWIGSNRGLDLFLPEQKAFKHFRHDPKDLTTLAHPLVLALLEDSQDRLWVGTQGGLNRISQDGNSFESFDAVLNTGQNQEYHGIADLYEDSASNLWIGFFTEGLIQLDASRQNARHFRASPDPTTSLSHSSAIAMHEEPEGILWIGTMGGGLNRFELETGSFQAYGREDGLPSDLIGGILSGGDGTLWLSTDRGLARFHLDGRVLGVFDENDGLPASGFVPTAALSSPSGTLIFGAEDGFVSFNPQHLRPAHPPSLVILTGLEIGNRLQNLRRMDPASPLNRPISVSEKMVLSHRQNDFTFLFSALEFASPHQIEYSWRLRGFDSAWKSTDASRRLAHYSNLPAGSYTFEARSRQAEGSWGPKSRPLTVIIEPPPWKSSWAYLLYTLILCSLAGSLVTSQRTKIAKERETNRRLRRVDRLKDEFLANTSHELRTPLHGLLGMIESALDEPLEPELQRKLKLATSSGRRLDQLIDDILDFSKLRDHGLDLYRTEIDLHTLVESVTMILQPLAEEKHLKLDNRVPVDFPFFVADEQRLRQILYNLMGNAIKFTDQGLVAVHAERLEDTLEIRVIDSGEGIPQEQIENIFQPFVQADGSIERLHGGTGLGLAISRQLAELHGGGLKVESEVGQGSTFVVTLPLRLEASTSTEPMPILTPMELPKIEPIPGNDQGSQELESFDTLTASTPSTPSTAPAAHRRVQTLAPEATKRILVVDDEPINRQVLTAFLSSSYTVVEASNGQTVLDLLAPTDRGSCPFDLLLLDVMMPGLSGFEVCKALRETHPPLELPIIFLTAATTPEDRLAGLAAGGNDYLGKPISKAELLVRVKLHLRLQESHRRIEGLLAERTEEVKTLSGLLPICASCKKIRDDEGYWNEVEVYIGRHTDAKFSHGICPDCATSIYGV